MVGVLVNVFAIIFGSLLGLLLRKGISDRYKNIVMQAIGLSVLVIGIFGAIKTEEIILLVISLVLGGLIGTFLMIEKNLEKLGDSLESKFKNSNAQFSKGFVMASLVYCVGAMAIVGSIEAGVNGNNEVLFTKAILDGVTAVFFTASLGYGVLFSSIPVFIYQGSITVFGIYIKDYLNDSMINEVSAVGSVLILGIGLSMLEIKKVNVGDLLPAVLIPIVYFLLI
ncbi:hypothetical protein CI105_03655 [Candidatus Izimaplasma bacterium ZiA1]|uniref:DUF554 domain-containing protein n=1 Tax=Candidatus Izimoplasma sp. ZiA1 TaxID=2024899 RepID=UPI000BAA770D|nr:hypothetical protein CI105_03655 [Candidatus Izimaplasma bacterium ZiA1]